MPRTKERISLLRYRPDLSTDHLSTASGVAPLASLSPSDNIQTTLAPELFDEHTIRIASLGLDANNYLIIFM